MNQQINKISPSARRKSRALAVQAVFQWELTKEPINNAEAYYLADVNPKKVDVDYLFELINGVLKSIETIDAEFTPFLDRRFTEIDQVELAILRVAIYELLCRIDVPYKVVINEALELTKIYGSIEGFKFVNGVLDKAARKIRVSEMG